MPSLLYSLESLLSSLHSFFFSDAFAESEIPMAGNRDKEGRRKKEIHPLPHASSTENASGLWSLHILPAANTHLLFPAIIEDIGRAAVIVLLSGGLVLSITQEQIGNALPYTNSRCSEVSLV